MEMLQQDLQTVLTMKSLKKKGYESSNTADEAIDSRWVIGSPTYLTVFLKYKS
jgi:hypothetical protein